MKTLRLLVLLLAVCGTLASGQVQVEMGERGDKPIRSSVVAAGGGIFLRIGARLYHIGRE